jgi:hypothetical protein
MKRASGLLLVSVLAGCGGDARVDLSAADGIRAAAQQMELTLREYHDEVAGYDSSREGAVITAFVSRVRADSQNEAAIDGHAAEFLKALEKIRTDRETEFTRQAAANDNVSVLREMARGLKVAEIAIYLALGQLPEPELAHRFC